jgi:hypothetical protein
MKTEEKMRTRIDELWAEAYVYHETHTRGLEGWVERDSDVDWLLWAFMGERELK